MSGGYDPKKINFAQLNAMMQAFMQERQSSLVCHQIFLERASQMSLAPEIHALIAEYSDNLNRILALTIEGIEEILKNDIGAPAKGGLQ